ncbi:MAG: hypothetical protein M3350_04595 [Actinomycetota bacterium]|nr:hypothetical protein [Actinomycetota bacterium]
MAEEPVLVEIRWVANPFRGEAFEDAWMPAAEAALDYGATYWSFYRAKDGLLDFTQHALVPDKESWERYWYSEEIATARTEASGLYQVPVLPTFHQIVGSGSSLDASTTTGPRLA